MRGDGEFDGTGRSVEHGRWRLVAGASAAALVGVFLYLGLSANVRRADDQDRWLYALFGQELLAGAALYRDLWDIKPPGIFWLNAASIAVARGSMVGPTVLAILAAGGAVALLYAISRRVLGRWTALVGVVLAALYLVHHAFRIGSNRPETFLVLTDLVAVACALRGLDRRRARAWMLAAGAASGASMLLKQTGLASIVAVLVVVLACPRGARVPSYGTEASEPKGCPPNRFALLGCFAAGMAAMLVLAMVMLRADGSLAAAWGAVVSFPARQRAGSGLVPPGTRRWLWLNGRDLAVPLALAALGLAGVWRKGSARTSTIWLVAWLLSAIFLALVSPWNRDWYLAPALPPLLLLATAGLGEFGLFLRDSWLIRAKGRVFAAGVVGVLLAGGIVGDIRAQAKAAVRTARQGDVAARESGASALVEAIRAHSAPTDTIFVFGYRPDVLWRAERRLAIPYPGTLHAAGWSDPRNDLLPRIIAALQSRPPVVLIGDPPAPKVGSNIAAGAAAEFATWRERHYRRPDPQAWPKLWVRRGLNAP